MIIAEIAAADVRMEPGLSNFMDNPLGRRASSWLDLALLFDGQIRGDFFQNDVSDDNHGLSGQQFNARGISLTGNVAYNQNLGSGWFVEPSAGIVWSRTQVDSLNVPGTMVLAGGPGPSGEIGRAHV